MAKVKAMYVSVWDGGTRISTPCKFNTKTKEVSEINCVDVEELDICEDEFVLLNDGTEIRDFINLDNL